MDATLSGFLLVGCGQSASGGPRLQINFFMEISINKVIRI